MIKTKHAAASSNRGRVFILLIMCICSLALSGCSTARQQTIIFADHLTDVAVTIDDKEYTLEDMAFYVSYLEDIVQDAAYVYNPEDTNAFWNLHMNKNFLRVMTRDEAMNMAIHDFIYLEKAKTLDMELSEDETAYADSRMDDFWMDLPESAHEKLGVDHEVIRQQVRNLALSQKAQELEAQMANIEYEDLNMSGYSYKKELEKHKVKINRSIWDGLSFGRVTL